MNLLNLLPVSASHRAGPASCCWAEVKWRPLRRQHARLTAAAAALEKFSVSVRLCWFHRERPHLPPLQLHIARIHLDRIVRTKRDPLKATLVIGQNQRLRHTFSCSVFSSSLPLSTLWMHVEGVTYMSKVSGMKLWKQLLIKTKYVP